MVIDINNKKSKSKVEKMFEKLDFTDPSMVNNNLKAVARKTQECEGRDEALSQKVSGILKGLGSGSNNVDFLIMKQIDKLNETKKLKTSELMEAKRQN